jgi:hypothetical protein
MTNPPDTWCRLAGGDVAIVGEHQASLSFKRRIVRIAVAAFAPEAVMHQLTDLPDKLDELAQHAPRDDRMRSEGTRILIAAAKEPGATSSPKASPGDQPGG